MKNNLNNKKFLLKKCTENILSFLYFTDKTNRRLGLSGNKSTGSNAKFCNHNILNVDSFDKIEMLIDSFSGLKRSLEEEDIYLHHNLIHPNDVQGIDQSIIKQCPSEFEYNNIPCDYYLARLKQIPLKSLRGIVSPLSPYCYLLMEAYVHPDGTMTTFRNNVCWSQGKMHVLSNTVWRSIGDPFGKGHAKWVFDQDVSNNALMPFIITYTNLTNWRVALGFKTRTRVCLNLSPETLKLMFNDRDKVLEKNRRPPLQHLVRAHSRSHSYKLEEYISVMEHMRGSVNFNWYGLSCEILPPEWVLKNIEYKKFLKKLKDAAKEA